MSDTASQIESDSPRHEVRGRRRFYQRKRFWFLAVLVCMGWAFWQWHVIALERLVRMGLEVGAAEAGFSFERADIRARLGAPLVIENAVFGPAEGAASECATRVRVARIELALQSFWHLLRDQSRPVARLSITGLEATLDYRSGMLPEIELPPDPSEAELERASRLVARFLPERMVLEAAALMILADGQRYEFQEIEAEFVEQALGEISIGRAELDTEWFRHALVDGSAATAWRDGKLVFSGLDFAEGIRVERFSADLVRVGGVGLEGRFSVYGGWLSAEAGFGQRNRKVWLDASARAGGIPLPQLLGFLGLDNCSDGFLREARVSFSGAPEAPQDAHSSLALRVESFEWEGRGFDTLELGLDLIDRRLALSHALLSQVDNRVRARGHLVVRDAFELANADFALQAEAELNDLEALAGLAGEEAFVGTHGTAGLVARVRAADGDMRGELSLTGSGLGFRNVEFGDATAEIEFHGAEARVREFTLEGPNAKILARGEAGIAEPFHYRGELDLEISDLAVFHALGPAVDASQWPSGELTLHWQGDGTVAAHSGAIESRFVNLRTEALPEAVSGELSGTYSPENLHLGKVELAGGKLRLNTELSAGKSGIHLNRMSLFAAERLLAAGQIYLPLDPRPLLTGGEWTEGLLEERSIYADVRTRELEVAELLRLFGMEPPVEAWAQLELRASGELAAPEIEASLRARDIRASDPAVPSPASSLVLEMVSKEGRADVDGTWTVEGFQPMAIRAALPFGIVQTENGAIAPADMYGPMEASLDFPGTELRAFRAFLPEIARLEGVLSGTLNISNTLADPVLRGHAQLTGGAIAFDPAAPAIEDLEIRLEFEDRRARIERFSGTVGAGLFHLTGGVNFADLERPEISLNLNAERVLLARNPQFLLRANIHLTASGAGGSGKVSGAVRLVDGRILQRLEITPLLVTAEEAHAPLLLPDLDGHVPEPFGSWQLDVSVKNETPFVIQGNIASGEIAPDLTVGGSLADPRPTGVVRLKDVRAYLPFTVMTISDGTISLQPDNPRVPMLDVRATAEALEYNIQAYAFGPLDERNVLLRSDPPLSQESIILLLTTGLAPGATTGAGFGEAAVGQGGLLLLRAFARQFETDVDLDSLINRLEIRSIPPPVAAGQAAMRGSFRLTDNIAVMTERDGSGFFNAGVTYSIRFR